jgi:hypothetical protein
MNWSAVGAIAELLGATAVVISLLYLATQVRNGIRQGRLEAGRSLSKGISDVSLALSINGELGDIYARGSSDFESLDPGDQFRYRTFLNSVFKLFEQMYFLQLEGSLDPEIWKGSEGLITDLISAPGVQRYARDRCTWYSESFMRYLVTRGLPEFEGRDSYLDQIGYKTDAAVPTTESA